MSDSFHDNRSDRDFVQIPVKYCRGIYERNLNIDISGQDIVHYDAYAVHPTVPSDLVYRRAERKS